MNNSYGVCSGFENYILRPGEQLIGVLLSLMPKDVQREYFAAWTLNRHEFDGETEFAESFVREYRNSEGEVGAPALMAELINKNEFGGKRIMRCSGEELFADMSSCSLKEESLLEQQVDDALKKYFDAFFLTDRELLMRAYKACHELTSCLPPFTSIDECEEEEVTEVFNAAEVFCDSAESLEIDLGKEV